MTAVDTMRDLAGISQAPPPAPTSERADLTGRFGDRHLRRDPDGKLSAIAAPQQARVRVAVDADFGRTLAGQLGAWLCVNLLARLDGLVSEIELDCPLTDVRPLLKCLRPNIANHENLVPLLAEMCATASAGRVRLFQSPSTTATVETPVATQIVIGLSVSLFSAALRTVWCFGSGWRAYMGSRRPALPLTGSSADRALAPEQESAKPLGLYVAVCYAVAEVFKTLRGVKPGLSTVMDDVYFSLWTGEIARSWDELGDGPSIGSLRLPAAYIVGAGAVGQAVAFAVATATAGAEFVTAVDEEAVDRNNRNRYVLTGRDDEGTGKAKLVAEFLQSTGTPAHHVASHWLPYTMRADPHPNARLATLEHELQYELILSCVDTNLARREIQQFWPRDLIGGSTDGLRAMAVHYDLRTPSACLSCHNPLHDFEREAARLRQELAGKPREQQLTRLLELGIAPDALAPVLEYLDRPKCGELGEAVLQKFAEQGPPAFSVGFVSVAAGLLLARNWIRYALLGPDGICPPDRHYLTMNFFNGRSLWTEQGMRQGCVCQSEGRALWNAMWSNGAS